MKQVERNIETSFFLSRPSTLQIKARAIFGLIGPVYQLFNITIDEGAQAVKKILKVTSRYRLPFLIVIILPEHCRNFLWARRKYTWETGSNGQSSFPTCHWNSKSKRGAMFNSCDLWNTKNNVLFLDSEMCRWDLQIARGFWHRMLQIERALGRFLQYSEPSK